MRIERLDVCQVVKTSSMYFEYYWQPSVPRLLLLKRYPCGYTLELLTVWTVDRSDEVK